MAYISAFKVTTYDSAAGSSTGVLPDGYVSGDLLIAVYKMQNGANDFTTPTQDGGWASIGSAGSGNITTAAFYKTASSSSMADPVSNHTSEQYRAVTCIVVKDAPAVSPIDTSASSFGYNASANTRASRSATTGQANTLLIHTIAEPQWRQYQPDPGPMLLYRQFFADGAFSGGVAWTFEDSLGAAGTFNWRKLRGSTEDVTGLIAIKSDSGVVPARGGAACSTPVFCGVDGGYYGYTVNNIAATLTAIDGVTTTNNPAGTTTDLGAGYNPYSYAQRFQGTAATSGLQAVVDYSFDAGAKSISGKKFCISWAFGQGQYRQRVDTLENNGIVLGLRSGTNEYRLYRAGGSDAGPLSTTAIVFDDNTAGIPHTGGGTFDPTDVTAVVASVGNASNTTYANIDQFHILEDIEIIGGNSVDPEGWRAAYEISVAANIPTVEKLGDAYRTKQDITVGNGSDFLNFDTNGTTLFLTRAASVARKDVEMQAAGVAIDLYAVSGDTLKLNDPVVSAGNSGDTFSINASATSAATWDWTGAVIKGFATDDAVTLRAVGAGTGAGSFIECGEIAHNNFDFTNGWLFSGCVGTQAITIEAANQGDLQTALNRLANCSFTNSSTYGLTISFTGTGDVSLNAPTGLSVDKTHYTSTNASALTMVVGSSGASFGTTSTGGSATGFTVSNDKTYTINVQDESGNALSGCEVTLLQRGTQTEVDHDNNTASGTYSYTFTYSSDVNLDVSVFKEGYVEYWDSTAQLLNSDQTITVTLQSVAASQN